MKPKCKSGNHKADNLYKFQTFSERLSGVNIDVARRVQHISATPEDASTFFGEALDKWSELNCTQNFVDFRRELVNKINSLAQLIHHKDEIVKVLQTHFKVTNTLALQPLLDLLVQLSRDLQSDFYPYFKDFFTILISLLKFHHHDVEKLEQVFSCLAYIFKFLWRTMLKDINNVYNIFSPLLGNEYKTYINSFAAESFAFLIRKSRDHVSLFRHIFEHISSGQSSGVGYLMFETVKGVQKQFHSAIVTLLPSFLQLLLDGSLTQSAVSESLLSMWQCMADYVKPESSTPVWTALITEIQKLNDMIGKDVDVSNVANGALAHMLSLMRCWLQFHDGNLIQLTEELTDVFVLLLSNASLSVSCSNSLLNAISEFLLASACKLSIHLRPKLIKNVFQCQCPSSQIFDLSRRLLNLSLYEKDVLPELLHYCETKLRSHNNQESQHEVLDVLCELVLHFSPNVTSGHCDIKPTTFLDFTGQNAKKSSVISMLNSICSTMSQNTSSQDNGTDLSQPWAALVCLPHIKPFDEAWSNKLLQVVHSSANRAILAPDLARPILTVWAQAVIALMKVSDLTTFYEEDKLPSSKICDILQNFPDNVDVLRVASLYFYNAKQSSLQKDIMSESALLEIFPGLQSNLSSPYSQIRALTLEICTEFDIRLPQLEDDVPVEQNGVFAICLAAERIEASIHTYRDKLVHLRRLEWDILQNQLPKGELSQVGIRYLLGSLYVNFTYLYEPLMDLITSHAYNMDTSEFWSVFGDHLSQAGQKTETLLKNPAGEQSCLAKVATNDKLSDLFFRYWQHEELLVDRPDFSNYRTQLWKTMCKFPGQCEPRSRVIVPLFFDFLDNEFYPADLNVAPTQNIKKFSDASDVIDDGDCESNPKKHRRAPNKTLVTHLKLFTLFRKPKSLFGEPRLKELYNNLLFHKDIEIQKVAFTCVSTYGYKSLTPYKENLERLLEDATFKSEIVLFSIDSDNGVLAEEHRKEVLPVLLRILYGKMASKTGKDTSGKSNTQLRKNIVLRFLAGCRAPEVQMFLDMIFEPFQSYCKSEDIMLLLKSIGTDVDLAKVIPLRKCQSVMSTVEILLKKLSHVLEDSLPSLLQVVIGLLGFAAHVLQKRQQIKPSSLGTLKAVRQLCLARLNQLMVLFPDYDWNTVLEGIFQAAVWPQIARLAHEGIYSPTGLLVLLHTWSKNAHYLPLLGKPTPHYDQLIFNAQTHSGGQSEVPQCRNKLTDPSSPNNELALPNQGDTPLLYMFNLLQSSNVQKGVVHVIMQIVDNLLVEEEPYDENSKYMPSVLNVEVPCARPELSVGINMLLSHVPILLDYLHKVVERLNGSKEDRASNLPTLELSILARLAPHVTDSVQSGRIVDLLLPLLAKNINRSEDLELSVLQAAGELLRTVPHPETYLPTFAPLFSKISSRPSRAAMCQALLVIGSRCEAASNNVELVNKLNSWDRRRVEEPDYMHRLEAYESAKSALTGAESVDNSLLLLLVHNCCYMLSNFDDMSLRDSSVLCLTALIQRIATDAAKETSTLKNSETSDIAEATPRILTADKSPLFHSIIIHHLLPLVKEGIKHKTESARHEYLTLLACLVRAFPGFPAFADLAHLSDDHDDELDFFLNITHIQIHRRGRAMKRLAKQLPTLHVGNQTLMTYVLPIITTFLKDEAYSKNSNILDCAVEGLAAVCRMLPWPRYSGILRHYLTLLPRSLTNQKLMVRIIVAILDNFHFDLGHSSEAGTSSYAGQDEKTLKDKTITSDDLTMDVDTTASADENREDDKETEPTTEGPRPYQKCAAGLATRIHTAILRNIIPQLHRALTQKAASDDQHKKAVASKYAEDDEILRVPIALAMVKLLQNMPNKTLHHNLPGVLLKVCTFLRSRAVDIRNTARDTLLKILQSLGPSYFSYVLQEMRSTLVRGYQLHVLCYTVYHLLHSLESLQPGDLDKCTTSLVQVFNEELFGHVSEEKDVDGITSKLFEARTSKSFDSYTLLGRYLTSQTLGSAINPLKDVLSNTHSSKVTRKVQESLRRLSLGLVENKGLELESLLTFTYAMQADILAELAPTEKDGASQAAPVPVDSRLPPPSTYLISSAAPRGGHKTKTHTKTNSYVIMEFGLQVLNLLLKRSRLSPTERTHLQLVDPFIRPLTVCLKAKNVKVTSTSLRCIIWLFKFPLPSLKKHIKAVAKSLFVLLHNYSTVGAGKGDNYELVVMCFKAMTVLVRDVAYHSVTTDQLQVLLGYAEQDVHDYSRQATAFTLLKAILSRKLIVPEMQPVMEKVRHLSITADSAHIRLQSRQVILTFLLEYPLGEKLKAYLEFYLSQLDYEYETGRESTLEMLATIFETFPLRLLTEFSAFFFIPLASRLLNDDSAKCRKLAALAIKRLMSKLDSSERDRLTNIAIEWLQDNGVQIRHLGALILGLVVEVEGQKFDRHLEIVLPVIVHQTLPDKYTSAENESEARSLDHLLFAVLTLTLKIFRESNQLLRSEKWCTVLGGIWCHIEEHLLHAHAWVRLVATQLLGMLFAAWSPNDIVGIMRTENSSSSGYLEHNTTAKLHRLCGAAVKQLAEPNLDKDMAEQVVKNLVYLAKVLVCLPEERMIVTNTQHKPSTDSETNKGLDSDNNKCDTSIVQNGQVEKGHWISLDWLAKKMVREARAETANNSKSTLKRSCIFKWLAAVAISLGRDRLAHYLPVLLPPVASELLSNSPTEDAELRNLCGEVVDLMKSTVGVEAFTQHYSKVQKSVSEKKDTRKRQRAQDAVSKPEIAAKRRVKKNVNKKDAKKRRIDEIRPSRKFKKAKI